VLLTPVTALTAVLPTAVLRSAARRSAVLPTLVRRELVVLLPARPASASPAGERRLRAALLRAWRLVARLGRIRRVTRPGQARWVARLGVTRVRMVRLGLSRRAARLVVPLPATGLPPTRRVRPVRAGPCGANVAAGQCRSAALAQARPDQLMRRPSTGPLSPRRARARAGSPGAPGRASVRPHLAPAVVAPSPALAADRRPLPCGAPPSCHKGASPKSTAQHRTARRTTGTGHSVEMTARPSAIPRCYPAARLAT
jgi:hypothetical protein